MSLFPRDKANLAPVAAPTSLQTPLGTVRFAVNVAGDAWENHPAQTYRVGGDGWLATWDDPALALELLVCRPVPGPERPLPVTDCWGACWWARAKTDCGSFVFTASWEPDNDAHDDGPDGGQHLHARTWSDAKTKVTLGTRDDEMLALRTRQPGDLPTAWAPHFRATDAHSKSPFWNHPIHHLLPRGIACPLPALEAGQQFQIAFAVAWADSDEPFQIATSLAVEVTPAQIIAGRLET